MKIRYDLLGYWYEINIDWHEFSSPFWNYREFTFEPYSELAKLGTDLWDFTNINGLQDFRSSVSRAREAAAIWQELGYRMEEPLSTSKHVQFFLFFNFHSSLGWKISWDWWFFPLSTFQEALELEFLARLQLQLGQYKEGRKSGEEALKIFIGQRLGFGVFNIKTTWDTCQQNRLGRTQYLFLVNIFQSSGTLLRQVSNSPFGRVWPYEPWSRWRVGILHGWVGKKVNLLG